MAVNTTSVWHESEFIDLSVYLCILALQASQGSHVHTKAMLHAALKDCRLDNVAYSHEGMGQSVATSRHEALRLLSTHQTLSRHRK